MKALIIAMAFTMFSVHVFATETIVINMVCNLSDLRQPIDKANIFNVNVSLKPNDMLALPSYLGHKYEVFTADVSNSAPRLEIGISARNIADNELVTSALAVYSADAPDFILQDGAHLLLRCAKP